MTNDQFSAIAELIRMRDGSSQRAARMVLVEGLDQQAAAKKTGLTQGGVSNAVNRCRRALDLAKIATK